ncbi:MAG: MlaD family protein [Hyphomonadaceae bacterium]
MNLERWGETILGAIVAIVAVGFFAFAAAQAGQSSGGGAVSYTARFQRADGVGVGADVRISGVKVGVVREIGLADDDTYFALLTLSLDRQIPNDSTARISSDGLLGGAYVSIEPAGVDMLASGEEIINTQGSIDLMTVFSSFARSGDTSQNEDATQ